MTTADNHDREYIMIWVWLVALLVTGTLIFMLPISKTAAIALIFGIAAVKAILVLRDYMHLKSERMLVYAIAAVPLVLAIGFALVLIPDIIFRR